MMVGFIVMDGFDLGIAMLLPVVSKDDDDRRLVINSVGPVWEGNQVWLIAGAGALFAALAAGLCRRLLGALHPHGGAAARALSASGRF